jgi:hypothetical protein
MKCRCRHGHAGCGGKAWLTARCGGTGVQVEGRVPRLLTEGSVRSACAVDGGGYVGDVDSPRCRCCWSDAAFRIVCRRPFHSGRQNRARVRLVVETFEIGRRFRLQSRGLASGPRGKSDDERVFSLDKSDSSRKGYKSVNSSAWPSGMSGDGGFQSQMIGSGCGWRYVCGLLRRRSAGQRVAVICSTRMTLGC